MNHRVLHDNCHKIPITAHTKQNTCKNKTHINYSLSFTSAVVLNVLHINTETTIKMPYWWSQLPDAAFAIKGILDFETTKDFMLQSDLHEADIFTGVSGIIDKHRLLHFKTGFQCSVFVLVCLPAVLLDGSINRRQKQLKIHYSIHYHYAVCNLSKPQTLKTNS